MFWRSVVGKLAITILLLVSFVLFILTILLLNFFEGFHREQVIKNMEQTASKITHIDEHYEDEKELLEAIERVKNPLTRVVISYRNGATITSDTEDRNLIELTYKWLNEKANFQYILRNKEPIQKNITLPENDEEVMLVGIPLENDLGVVYVYESIDYVNAAKAETTKIVFLAAMISIILTTILSFFLSTRITAPLIKLRKAAMNLTRGQFDTRVPVLAYDEIGELAISFNRMGNELKFHVDALEREKEQLKSIVNSMADGIITIDREGKVLLYNPPAEQFVIDWNYQYHDSKDERFKQLPVELLELLSVAIEDKGIVKEFKVQGRYWMILTTPLYDGEEVRGAVLVIRDMTEERTLDTLRKDFVANVSHELRTPISLLQGYSEAIVDNIAETIEEKNELATIILEESLRMSRLVNELLDIAQMEAGQVHLNRQNVHLKTFIHRVLNKFRRQASKQNIQLTIEEVYEEAYVFIDEDRIEQVLTNLIDNAMSYMEKEGKIIIYVENTKNLLTIEVEDDGLGIPEEDIPFIFERFYKVDKSRVRNDASDGTGLGLSIAKNIIQSHGGKIFVKSKQKEGTIFTIQIENIQEW